MNFEQALTQFTYDRIEEILLNPDNQSLNKIYSDLEIELEKLGIDTNDCEHLKLVVFQLIDRQSQLVYRLGLSDAITFIQDANNTKNYLEVTK